MVDIAALKCFQLPAGAPVVYSGFTVACQLADLQSGQNIFVLGEQVGIILVHIFQDFRWEIYSQRMMLRQYAAEHGLTVVDEYIDDGWSGTNFERPSFQRMIDDIEDGKINCVVTKDYCAIIGLNQKDLENQGILA